MSKQLWEQECNTQSHWIWGWDLLDLSDKRFTGVSMSNAKGVGVNRNWADGGTPCFICWCRLLKECIHLYIWYWKSDDGCPATERLSTWRHRREPRHPKRVLEAIVTVTEATATGHVAMKGFLRKMSETTGDQGRNCWDTLSSGEPRATRGSTPGITQAETGRKTPVRLTPGLCAS